MPDADERPGDEEPAGSRADTGAPSRPILIADEAPAPVPLGANPVDDSDGGGPQDPYQVILWGFRTVSQTLSEAYGTASCEVQKIIWSALRTSTTEDWTFV